MREVSTTFLLALGASIAALWGARFLAPGLPLPGAVTLRPAELAMIAVGLVLLAFHCAAMFFTDVAGSLSGTDAAIGAVNALGTASVVWYLVPALLTVTGLRGLPPLALAGVVLALLTIGVTMYNGGPLDTHLIAIFSGVVLLAAVLAWLVQMPSRAVA